MRHARRHGGASHEFGGSGEDSFVAVVVTKLTGALLFILLLTMVIMALLPKAVDPGAARPAPEGAPTLELTINTPEALPEAIAGHPYALALAATGGRGPLTWSLVGNLPDGLTLDTTTGRIEGTPKKGTPRPVELVARVSDGFDQAAGPVRLVIYQSDRPLTTPAWWKPGIPPVPWKAWLEQGFGFLLLALVHLVGMNAIGSLERWSRASGDGAAPDPEGLRSLARRFGVYRWTVRLASLTAVAALAVWLGSHHA